MEALKDQMTSMMEAMLSMKQMMESNAAAIAATSATIEADPTHPSAINQANQPIPDIVAQGGEVLGSIDGPIMGHNRNAYTYGLPLPIIHRPPCTCPTRTLTTPFPLPLRASNPSL